MNGANGGSDALFRRVVRPVLFRLEPERSHKVARFGLRHPRLWTSLSNRFLTDDRRLETRLGSLVLKNPVGLAAGFDKDGDMVDSLQCLGFGSVTIGSILPEPRSGNPRPRVARYPTELAVANCLGLPSRGVDYVAHRLRDRKLRTVPVIASIQGFTIDGFRRCAAAIGPLVDGLELSVSCPNVVEEHEDLLEPERCERLISSLGADGSKPILVKIPFYDTAAERNRRLELVSRAMRLGVAGFTVSGTFTRAEPTLSIGRANVSGGPARDRTLTFVRDLWEATEGKAIIRASGGMSTGVDVYAAIAAGATTIDLLTGFIYGGWGVARSINTELLELMERRGFDSVEELRGSSV